MATNKNAVIRYMFIDDMLKSKSNHYTTREICDECNKYLENSDKPTVDIKTYQNDLNDMKMPPFNAEIVSEYEGKRLVNYYKDPTFSIFKPKLTDDEKHLLTELLNVVGGLSIEGFEWLDDLKKSLNIEKKETILDFESNPNLVMKENMLSRLFSVIAARKAINLSYKKFDAENANIYSISPLMLKQFNNRWFLIAKMNDDGFVCNFALDRIEDFIINNRINCKHDIGELDKRFDNIVGVTLPKDAEPVDILIWADDNTYKYIDTKPIHKSQESVCIFNNEILREKYPMLNGGKFFHYKLIINTELMNVLMSYRSVIVLEPTSLKDEMKRRVCELMEKYEKLS